MKVSEAKKYLCTKGKDKMVMVQEVGGYTGESWLQIGLGGANEVLINKICVIQPSHIIINFLQCIFLCKIVQF